MPTSQNESSRIGMSPVHFGIAIFIGVVTSLYIIFS